jgi:ATP phosphoribosyltransferase
VRLALARDAERPPEDLLELLAVAGLAGAQLRTAAVPALIRTGEVEWILADPRDVLTICALGGADAGVVGKEALVEHGADLFELLDLGVARRRLVWAAPADAGRRRLRLATRYPRTTADHFVSSGRDVETLAVQSSPWLAVALGLADGVVEVEDRIRDGEPDLVVREVVAEGSARLVTGRQARTLRGPSLAELVDRLRDAQGGA